MELVFHFHVIKKLFNIFIYKSITDLSVLNIFYVKQWIEMRGSDRYPSEKNLREKEHVTRWKERNLSWSVLAIQFYFAPSDVWRLVKFAYPHCREFFVAGSEDKFRARRLRLPRDARAKFHLEEAEILVRSGR